MKKRGISQKGKKIIQKGRKIIKKTHLNFEVKLTSMDRKLLSGLKPFSVMSTYKVLKDVEVSMKKLM